MSEMGYSPELQSIHHENFHAKIPSKWEAGDIIDELKRSDIGAIAVLGGGYKKIGTGENIKPILSSYDSSKSVFPDRISAVKARAIAVQILSRDFPQSKVVTLSRAKPEGEPSEAEVLHEFISRDKSINPERYMQNELSTATITEMMEIIEMAVQNEWKSVAVVTNDWHWERVRTMYRFFTDEEKREDIYSMLRKSVSTNPEEDSENEDLRNVNRVLEHFEKIIKQFIEQEKKLVFVPAENVLSNENNRYEKIINDSHSEDAEILVNPIQLERMKRDGVEYTVIDPIPNAEGSICVKTYRLRNQLRSEGQGIQDLHTRRYKAGRPGDENNLFAKYCRRKAEVLVSYNLVDQEVA